MDGFELGVLAVAVTAAVGLVILPPDAWAPNGLGPAAQAGELPTGEAVSRLRRSAADGVVRFGPRTPTPFGTATKPPAAASQRWAVPVRGRVNSGFRTAGRPHHDGVDVGAPRGTAVRALGGGVVIVVRCEVAPVRLGCDVDGTRTTAGCGWYVDIQHEGGVRTRYCHLLRRPRVTQGQRVAAGEVIGLVGTSGHSTGPHLHFEVLVRGAAARHPELYEPVDPIRFLALRGVRLGRG